jgi:integrase
LLEYVERQRAAGRDRLFHTLRANTAGSITDGFGQYYGRWARTFVPDRRKTAHSWRHTVATKLRQSNVREDLMDELLGWTQTKMASRYGSGHTIQAKRDAIERVTY